MLSIFFSKIILFIQHVASVAMKHPRICLAILCCVSLVLKLLVRYMEPTVSRDSAFYLYTVQDWYDTGKPPVLWIPPMLFCLVRGVMFLGIDAETAGLIVNMGLGSCLPFLTWGIAREASGNKKVALAAAFFAAIHPTFITLATEILREIPYLFFSGFALWLFFAALKRKCWYLWCCSGGMIALANLTRYESFELLPLFLLAVLIFVITRHLSWRQGIGYACCFITSLAVVLFAFLYFYEDGKMYGEYEKYFTRKFNVVKQRQFRDSTPNGTK